ncbi:MAG: hypothetical protein ACR2O6_07870 [Ilumatobacteraceae bacterium]
MTPSQLRLFTTKEQTLLVSTETDRLADLDEDELGDLLTRVRRLRNNCSDLHRTQGRQSVAAAGKRYAATSSNERSARKVEVAEDAVSRIAHHLSRAARANANELKAERLAAARGGSASRAADTPAKKKPKSAKASKASEPKVSGARVGSTSARTKRKQAAKDGRSS